MVLRDNAVTSFPIRDVFDIVIFIVRRDIVDVAFIIADKEAVIRSLSFMIVNNVAATPNSNILRINVFEERKYRLNIFLFILLFVVMVGIF